MISNSISVATAVNKYQPGHPASLPRRIRDLCDGGTDWETERYHDRFAARKAVTYACYAAGWSFDQAFAYLLGTQAQARPAYELWGSSRRHVTAGERQQRLYKDWQEVAGFAPLGSRPDVLAVCGELRDAVAVRTWAGVAGRNRREVLLTAIGFAEHGNGLVVMLPVRHTAISSGMSMATVSRHLKWLLAEGWLEPVREQGTAANATKYRLSQRPPLLREVLREVLHDETDCGFLFADPESVSSCNTRRATRLCATELGVRLGKAATDVYLALAATGASAAELARRAGVHRATATRALAKLEEAGLAALAGGGWVLGPKDWDEADPASSTVAQRRAQYQRDQDAFRALTAPQQAHVRAMNGRMRFYPNPGPGRLSAVYVPPESKEETCRSSSAGATAPATGATGSSPEAR